MSRSKTKRESDVEEQALQLLDDPHFLYRAGEKIGDLGVVGEERNRLVIFLSGVTRKTRRPASVAVKGAASSGKTTLVKTSIQLFPADCVIERAGLSRKALAHGHDSLAEKILFFNEYHSTREAQLQLRLIQSDGQIKHEFTTIRGVDRSTQVAERVGFPVVLTTTTDSQIYADDETRFLSVWADESAEQSLAFVLARASGPRAVNYQDVPAWRMATSRLGCREGDFENPPLWIRSVAERLPLGKVRVRRDWDRFLSFCSAIALCRAGARRSESPLDLAFSDYCVAFRILEPVFASTLRGVRTQELDLRNAVARLSKKLQRATTVQELASELGWKESLVYKHAKRAVERRVLEYEPGTRERNEKRFLASEDGPEGFLPKPALVLKENPDIGKEVEYIDPFTGEDMIVMPGKRAGTT